MKRIILLGATGSIGQSACDVVRTHPDDFRIVAVAALHNRAACDALAAEFGAKAYVGDDAAVRAVEENAADLVLVSTVGLSGLAPTLAAIDKGVTVALATKEVMVAAGALVAGRARAGGVKIIPVDSEHSAIFQCLQENLRVVGPAADFGGLNRSVERLLLTASGGPFLEGPADLSQVSPAMALNHPRWKMGAKVTVDSSTMMNKGFEILEARWLFDVPVEQIDVVVHPESIVHSLVTFNDGATLAQLSPPDMRLPIQYAFSWPERLPASERPRLDLPRISSLTFRTPDIRRFPCLELVKAATRLGGTATAALSAADEVAVERFLSGEIGYLDIYRLVSDAVQHLDHHACESIAAVMDADQAARAFAREWRHG